MKTSNLIRLCLWVVLISMSITACQSKVQFPANCANVPGICLTITNSNCPGVTINYGEQVSWINQDDQDHLIKVQSSDGQFIFGTDKLQPGSSASFTFPQAGTYSYACSEGQGSPGVIIVNP